METITKYIEKIKAWSKKHPVKASFVSGFVAGFIIKGVIF